MLKCMQELEKQALTEKLITLVSQRLGDDANLLSGGDLERDMFTLVDQAFTDSLNSRRMEVNILLSDLRGFTAMAALCEAAELVELLNRYLRKMSEIILRYDGTIDKFMGDSIMALFGAPVGRPDDLERCLACAVDMQLAMNDINEMNLQLGLPELHMGIGINTGRVMAGSLGSTLHSEYTVIGAEVNIASRIEAHSLRGQILLSQNTYELAQDYIEIGGVNEVQVKGRPDAVRMYELRSTQKPQYLEVPQREARSSPRVAVDIPLSFQLVEGKSVKAELLQGRIIDLGYGGLMARVNEPISEHAEICIKLSLSLMSRESSDVYARVLRVNEADGEFECQMEFTFIEDSARRELKGFVDQIVETA